MDYKSFASTLLLAAIAAALTVTTLILAPLPLLLLRRNGGRLNFFFGALLATAVLVWIESPGAVAAFLAAVVMTFVYSECENQNIGYSSSVFISLLVFCGVGALVVGFAMQHYKLGPIGFFRNHVNDFMAQLTLPAGVKVDKEAVVRQIPSVLIIVIIFSIWLNSILVNRLERLLAWTPKYQKHIYLSGEFRNWKLPDSFVWLALASAAGAFFDFHPVWLHWVASNVFNIAVLLYFFQGLAVIVDFFAVKQVTPIWRTIAYLFIFSQFFLMVSFLGFVDLWMGFRKRTKSDKSAVA